MTYHQDLVNTHDADRFVYMCKQDLNLREPYHPTKPRGWLIDRGSCGFRGTLRWNDCPTE